MNPVLLGLFLIYGLPALVAALFWFGPVKRLVSLWTGRDVMVSFIPERWHVWHTERILRVAAPNPSEET